MLSEIFFFYCGPEQLCFSTNAQGLVLKHICFCPQYVCTVCSFFDHNITKIYFLRVPEFCFTLIYSKHTKKHSTYIGYIRITYLITFHSSISCVSCMLLYVLYVTMSMSVTEYYKMVCKNEWLQLLGQSASKCEHCMLAYCLLGVWQGARNKEKRNSWVKE